MALTNIHLHIAISAVVIGLLHVTCMITLGSGMKITNNGYIEQDTIIRPLTDDVKDRIFVCKTVIEPQIPKNIRNKRRINWDVKERVNNESIKILPSLVRNANNRMKNFQDNKCLKIEYLFILDGAFNGNPVAEIISTENYIRDMMNEVQRLFDTLELNIMVSKIGVRLLSKGNERTFAPYILESFIPYYPNVLDYNKTLSSMKEYYCGLNDLQALDADIIFLLTKHTLASVNNDGSLSYVAGAAHSAGGICNHCKKYAIGMFDKSYNTTASIVAYESAHLLGCMFHCQEPQNFSIPYSQGATNCPLHAEYIMDSGNVNARKFSTCSTRNVEYFLNSGKGDCIIETCNSA